MLIYCNSIPSHYVSFMWLDPPIIAKILTLFLGILGIAPSLDDALLRLWAWMPITIDDRIRAAVSTQRGFNFI